MTSSWSRDILLSSVASSQTILQWVTCPQPHPPMQAICGPNSYRWDVWAKAYLSFTLIDIVKLLPGDGINDGGCLLLLSFTRCLSNFCFVVFCQCHKWKKGSQCGLDFRSFYETYGTWKKVPCLKFSSLPMPAVTCRLSHLESLQMTSPSSVTQADTARSCSDLCNLCSTRGPSSTYAGH